MSSRNSFCAAKATLVESDFIMSAAYGSMGHRRAGGLHVPEKTDEQKTCAEAAGGVPHASPLNALPVAPPGAVEEEKSLGVHKPKPTHGWKAYFKELSTVVLGILIALGLEQTVQAIHARGDASDAEAAIRAEIADNASRLSYRVSHQACMEKRLDEVAGLLAGWADGKEIP